MCWQDSQLGFLGPDRAEEGRLCCSLAPLESVADGSGASSPSRESSLFLGGGVVMTEEAGWAAAGPAESGFSGQLCPEVTELSLCS